jgi:sugar/nucleoside kinase (ribokinase family)
LTRDFIITPAGNPKMDVPGGSMLYAAAGAAIWDSGIGLIGRASYDYPKEWLSKANKYGFDTQGVKILGEHVDHRAVFAYPESGSHGNENPVKIFAGLGIPYPKTLIGYTAGLTGTGPAAIPSALTIRANDIPQSYKDATAAHLCPLDYLTHSLLPSSLRQGNVSTITLSPDKSYMTPNYWEQIPSLLKGISAFITNTEKALGLFQGRSSDLWEIAEALASMGSEIIIIYGGMQGQYVYDRPGNKKWVVPAYPVKVNDPTGSEDAFCGGFLPGYKATFQPLEGALTASISAAMVMEDSGPFYVLGAMPGLAKARLEALRNMIRRV